MNSLFAIMPGGRASTSAFIMGLLALSALDAGRLAYGIGSALVHPSAFLFVWALVLVLFMNRRRDAGRGAALAFLPLGLGAVAKFIGALTGGMGLANAFTTEFMESVGIDTEDPSAMMSAVLDPDFQQAHTAALLAAPERAEEIAQAVIMGSFLGFWGVIGLFGFWFARMHKRGGALPG